MIIFGAPKPMKTFPLQSNYNKTRSSHKIIIIRKFSTISTHHAQFHNYNNSMNKTVIQVPIQNHMMNKLHCQCSLHSTIFKEIPTTTHALLIIITNLNPRSIIIISCLRMEPSVCRI